jgi:hypothetical protein
MGINDINKKYFTANSMFHFPQYFISAVLKCMQNRIMLKCIIQTKSLAQLAQVIKTATLKCLNPLAKMQDNAYSKIIKPLKAKRQQEERNTYNKCLDAVLKELKTPQLTGCCKNTRDRDLWSKIIKG